MSKSLQELCNILGVTPGASAREVKEAYRDLAKVWHPDRFPDSERLRQRAGEKLKEINDAYSHLKNGVPLEDFTSSRSGGAQQKYAPPFTESSQPHQSPETSSPSNDSSAGCAVAATAVVFLGCVFILPSILGENVQHLVKPGGWFTSAEYATVWETSWLLVTVCTAVLSAVVFALVRKKEFGSLIWLVVVGAGALYKCSGN